MTPDPVRVHRFGVAELAWQAPRAVDDPTWDMEPVVELEPNYETAHAYHSGGAFTDAHVRRAAWWSLLVSPTAGLTYGHDAIWNWNAEEGASEGHGNWHGGKVPPWHTGLETEGIRSMTVLRGILERLDWTTLVPAPSLLAEQPGGREIDAFVAVARTADGTVVAYAPRGGLVRFQAGALTGRVQIVDPRTGEASETMPPPADGAVALPDQRDGLVIAGL